MHLTSSSHHHGTTRAKADDWRARASLDVLIIDVAAGRWDVDDRPRYMRMDQN
jgi:hypothetical protein